MLARIAAFEFRYQLKNPVLWVAAAFFLLFSFSIVASEQVSIGIPGGNTHENGPFSIIRIHIVFSIFYMFVTTAFVANVIVRDDDTAYGPIIRSTRITKFQYLYGRFLGAWLVASLGFLTVPFGAWLGSFAPWVDQETLGPNFASYYLWPLLVVGLPNVLICSAIFFSLATATRSMMTTYLGVVVFLILWLVISVALSAMPDMQRVVSIIDPFGFTTLNWTMRYWTVAERNGQVPDIAGIVLWNRLMWLGLSVAFLALAHFAFRFSERGMSRRKLRKARAVAAAEAVDSAPVATAGLPAPRHDARSAHAQFSARTRFEMRQVLRSPAFIVLMVLGMFNAAGAVWPSGALYGTQVYPATFLLIPNLLGSFGIFPIIIAIYYSGELVWRERDRKMHEIIDATPLPNWAFAVPKTLAVSLVLVSTVVFSILAGLIVQLIKGFGDVRLDEYLLWYVLPTSVDVILIAVLSIFIQAMSPNKYVGWGVMVLYIVAISIFQSIGLEHSLYLYGNHPTELFSDINGAGIYWIGAWWLRFYWCAVAVLLLVASHLLWRRGTEGRFRPRLRLALARLRGPAGGIGAAALLTMVVTGAWIFYNTNILNDYRTRSSSERWQADYEKRYLRFETLPQPSISHVVLNVALHPEQVLAEVSGSYRLTNLSGQPVRQVHVRNPDRELALLSIDLPGARLISNDREFDYRIYRLDRPMAPGETRTLAFRTRRQQVGFRNQGADTRLVPNGTFLDNFEMAPAIGMNRNGLLAERTARRRYGLPPELRPPRLEDPAARRSNYFGGSWTTADITVSTAADQTPIAPGRKVSDRVAGGRRTARFISDAPILTFFSIQSARYAEAHRRHGGVDLGVYYHPAHAWNANRMLDALARSLDYYQANFGPYQFDQARIIEFPGYPPAFAQAFANTMPYSESIGFVADNSDPDTIDYVSYVTAHELGHQYWAHQVIGANAQGATMLSETLAQYSALMVMKHLYGEDKMRRFLRFELDNYLRRRGGEGIEEMPLARVENQPYIHYQKGSLVMYLLQERMGEAAVNRALRGLIARYRFRNAPYPLSTDLIALLRREATTPEQQALITDLFERITIYNMRVEQPTAVRRADGRWDVTVTVVASKAYDDGRGHERPIPLAERIEMGLFTALPGHGAFDRSNVILMERRPIHSGRQVLRFVTARRPTHAGVDPYNYYVDRNSDDNVAPVT